MIKRRDIPVWVLPGGGIEEGESPECGALREAEEESGLKLKIERKIAFYTPINRLTNPTHFFELSVIEGIPQVGSETREIGFFSIHELPKKLVPTYKLWIEDALLFSKEVLQKKIQKTSYLMLIRYLISHPILVIQYLLTKIGIHMNTK